MLGKGQGMTMGTFDTLLLAFDMDGRVDEAESFWNMILHTHTRSISKRLFSRMIDLAKPYEKSRSHPAALTTEKYGISNKELLKALVAREILLMKRNSFVYIFKSFQVSFLYFL